MGLDMAHSMGHGARCAQRIVVIQAMLNTHMSVELRPQLEVRDLELVLALAESGSTARAASRLHLTQSAISRALTKAEERVGLRLFERVARGVVPTRAGERLIAGAPRLLGDLRQLERSLAG